MNLSDLFKVLAKANIKLTVEAGSLSVTAPKGAMTPAILGELKNHKQKLIEYLQGGKSDVQRIEPVKRNEPLKLSYAQQSLWLLDKIDQGSAHYNDSFALNLVGQLDHDAMDRAFTMVFERHESLRTCFLMGHDDLPHQVIQAAPDYTVPVLDLTDVASQSIDARVSQLASEEAALVFDLSSDLMLRTRLLKTSAEQFTLLITMHHIASDGWSIGILVNEFSTLYAAYVKGEANPLPPLTIQYADYAHWQRQWLQGTVFEAQLGYWQQQLADLPVCHSLVLDHARAKRQSFGGSAYFTLLDA
ncbi:MAG: non-ribosomal peptide synthetase, partial [Algicola sp.]|nr:non-ribosomal peptide synthetase [Algicola sp.]